MTFYSVNFLKIASQNMNIHALIQLKIFGLHFATFVRSFDRKFVRVGHVISMWRISSCRSAPLVSKFFSRTRDQLYTCKFERSCTSRLTCSKVKLPRWVHLQESRKLLFVAPEFRTLATRRKSLKHAAIIQLTNNLTNVCNRRIL